jgi:uncharacterized protein (TIGR02118 family)
MIYRIGVINGKQGLSEAEFRQHWIHTHGQLASKLPGLRSYRQNHILQRLFETVPFPLQRIDGFSQLLFDSLKVMEDVEGSPEYKACKDDIPKFQGDITVLVAAEDLIAGANPVWGTPKLVVIWESRQKALDPDELRKELRKPAILGTGFPNASAVMNNTIVDKAHPVAAGVGQGAPNADAFTEIWFPNGYDVAQSFQSKQVQSSIFGNDRLAPIAAYVIEEIMIFKPVGREALLGSEVG